MRFLITTPSPQRSTLGNQITANRLSRLLVGLGHHVQINNEFRTGSFDCLIALHATRSANSVVRFKQLHPSRPIVVCLTGTDLHLDLQNKSGAAKRRKATQCLSLADRIVLLEPEGGKLLDSQLTNKLVVIFQSATPVRNPPPKLKRTFEVTVLSHLRDVKDPFLAARAANALALESKIKIVHLGVALSSQMQRRAMDESKTNSRYQWLGGLPHGQAIRRLARSKLTLVTSKIEGAPSVISEAIVNGVPILSTRIAASIGLLGGEYPGLFPVGDAKSLTQLLARAELDRRFYSQLTTACRSRRPLFHQRRETRTWKKLISELGV